MAFNCTSCGLCCRNIGKTLEQQYQLVPWMRPIVRDFPYKAKENGHCEMLEDNQCMVYEDRPLFCDIDRIANEVDMPIDKIKWYQLNYQGCNTLQMEIR